MFVRKYLLIAFAMIVTAFYACQSNEQKPQREPVPRNIPVRQEKAPVSSLDKSPMDMSYFPVDYPVLKMSGKIKTPPIARVIYSRPSKDGRVIFGNLVKYGERWRLGANEATEIEFFTDVTITGKKVKKGRYILYCIPLHDKWTLVLNNDLFVWGLKIHPAEDVITFDVATQPADHNYEVFTMEFEPAGAGLQLMMAWDNVKALLPIRY